jgi:two-component system nitrogen regulation sensor histidine kinase NtrY
MSETPAAQRRRLGDLLLGRVATVSLAGLALASGIATFVLLSGDSPLGPTGPGVTVAIILANTAVLLLLGGILVGRLVRLLAERRRGSAGARLQVRLVLLFGGVASVPALLVAVFSAVFFNLGIQAWFSDRVRSALETAVLASRAYLDDNRNAIRADALAMAADLNRAAQVFLPDNQIAFARVLATHTSLRGLTEAVVFEPASGRVLAQAGFWAAPAVEPPSPAAMEIMRTGEVAVLPGETEGRVTGLVALEIPPALLGGQGAQPLMLRIGRPVDPGVIEHQRNTELAFQEYDRLDRDRGSLQVSFALVFAIATLLVLLGAALIGLMLATQIAGAIGRLIAAADRVRGGDLSVRVEEGREDDELGRLARAFNRMTSQLSAQRAELMEAYRQIDQRRRFIESVLAGVSAGVIGLDPQGRIDLPNRSASALLERDLEAAIGRPLVDVAPEFGPLLAAAAAQPERPRMAEIPLSRPGGSRVLIARIGSEMRRGRVAGFVVTFDDITELQAAQRKAAWADVARRIAHEIKNPLTPIQLSAERLRRRYLKQITEDPETFRQLTDTIIRQVGDIGRMVDEFSAFARMPQPDIKPENPAKLVRDALALQSGRQNIRFEADIAPDLPAVAADRRLIGQALTNLLQNAVDSVAMREGAGHIILRAAREGEGVALSVLDDGIGLPAGEERERLTEPYVTHKPKGTGLGLAIVKKVMEDHGGRLTLSDRPDGPGAVATLWLPFAREPAPAEADAAHGA